MVKKIKALIAEDEENIALALRTIIKKVADNMEIVLVSDGEEAWKHLSAAHFDIIISDWNMPRMTGMELLSMVRNNKETSTLPFLMLTARTDQQSVLSAVQVGVTDYISKPFEKELVIEKIQRLLEANSSASESDSNIIDEFIKRLNNDDLEFPVLPEVGFRVADLMSNDNVSVSQITDLVKTDASLSTKLISIANSSVYRGLTQIKTLRDAITRIGLRETGNTIMALSSRGLFNTDSPIFEDVLRRLWEHSLATGTCARNIGRFLNYHSPEQLFTMGMLHDIGKLFLIKMSMELSAKGRKLNEESLHELLNNLHVDFGVVLLNRWNFPDEFINVVKFHHETEDANNLSTEVHIINLANMLVRKLGFSLRENDDLDITATRSGRILRLENDEIDSIGKDTLKFINDMQDMI